ncbi:hypothetical protein XBKQ1_530004 [Xenorhabdus bovienii str. kraussei Quebec]|uniref:Uncharacterized protein n=3 Tax=Xenorhabdus bovienii TaxID=40576 RepID=A0A077PKG3_XENBV|nr:hypothetical protein XBKQ1_530004 [Xenorhabdus bovienii str. kraussei Quebec]CDH22889.1 hypothetical protein XBKB1_140042 [Xenorhabdus bovienii str. kraussei Becker Underwood]CDM88286.1 conserved protein of unknown function [Xenorhabdus bovienii]
MLCLQGTFVREVLQGVCQELKSICNQFVIRENSWERKVKKE